MFFRKNVPSSAVSDFDMFAAEALAIRRSQAVIELTTDGKIIDANDNFLAVMGYTRDEIVGRHHSMFVDAAEAQGADYRRFWQRLAAGDYFAAEYRRIGKGGKEVWIQATYNPILGEDGTPVKIVKFASDTTAAKLKSTDDAGQINAIGLTQAVITFTLDGRVESANALFCGVMGYAEHEVVGRHHAMFVRPEDREGAEYRAFWASLNEGKCVSGEFCRLDRHGRQVWLQASYTPINDPLGRPIKVIKYATDITRQVEQRQKFNLLSLVADGTDNSVVITDREGHIVYVNSGFGRLTGYGEAEALGKRPGALLQGRNTDPETVARIRQKLAAGEAFYDEILNYNKAGEAYWISLAINPVRDRNGVVEKFISIQANITETKRQSLQFYTTLAAISASTAIGEWTLDGTCSTVNAFLADRPVVSLRTLLPADVLARVLGGAQQRCEITWPAGAQGEPMWLDAVFSVITDLAGKPDRVLMCAVDITPRRRTIMETSETMQAMLGRVTMIVGELDKIARMTNLLAMNAAVEAGRAAEAGKGFAVVADEVRKLADQSSAAAAQINSVIAESRDQIDLLRGDGPKLEAPPRRRAA